MNNCDGREFGKMSNNDKHKTKPLLKKRVNQWSHEVKKTVTNSPERVLPHFYGDRFIPRRYALKQKESNEIFLFTEGKEDFLSNRPSPNDLRYKNLKVIMNKTFGIKQRKVLEFVDLAEKNSFLLNSNILPSTPKYEFIYGNLNGFDWPCVPRSKFLACADTTHDLPHLDIHTEIHRIDWSVTGQIAASFEQELVLWTLSLDLTLSYKFRNSGSIAYCPKGKFLAIALRKFDYTALELWDISSKTDLYMHESFFFSKKNAVIMCIEWGRKGNVIACGLSSGAVHLFSSPDLCEIKHLWHHHHAVFMIKFSPNMRYLATSDIEGNIYVYNYPDCDVHVVLRSKRKLRVVIDWHPWNGTDLAISENSPASIVILHVPSREIVAYYQRKDKKIEIDFITFNKLTAELLVSYSFKDDDGCMSSEILVMSSLDCVVDVLRVPECSVRFMMWSPTGMQLATTGNDETLTIWNFLTKRSKNYKGQPIVGKTKKNIHADAMKMKFGLKLGNGSELKKWTNIR